MEYLTPWWPRATAQASRTISARAALDASGSVPPPRRTRQRTGGLASLHLHAEQVLALVGLPPLAATIVGWATVGRQGHRMPAVGLVNQNHGESRSIDTGRQCGFHRGFGLAYPRPKPSLCRNRRRADGTRPRDAGACVQRRSISKSTARVRRPKPDRPCAPRRRPALP